MANIVLRNGWNQPATYENVASVTFQTDVEGVTATYYENGSGGSGGLGVQANWSQNNDQAADHIKNRPFYSSYEEIIAPIAVELIDNGNGLYGAVLSELEDFAETEYTVIWGDDLWFCDVVEKEGKKYLGNLDLVGIATEITEGDIPPFVGIYEEGLLTFYSNSAAALNIGLGGPEIIHKINAKYLPDGLMGNADWNAKEGEPGYIANKPTTLGLDEEALGKYLADNKYVTESALDSYVTTAKLETTLGSYITSESLNATLTEKLKNYVTTSSLSNTLKSYYTGTQVDDKISTASTNIINQIDKELESYATLAKVNELLANLVDKNYVENRLTERLKESQADWSVEDTTKLSAIKNKPFGDIPDIIVITDELAPATFEAVEGGWQTSLGVALDETKEYVVFWGEIEVACEIGVTNEYFTLSADGTIFTTEQPDEGLKIGLRYADNVYRMQKKYLPVEELREDILEGMASEKYVDNKVAAIPQADWTEKDTGSQAYIKNKPAIPAAPVQSNWATKDTTSLAYIWNKPTIPDPQIQSDWTQQDDTKKDFIKNKPTIPDAQVQSNWTQTDSSKIDFIRNKPSFYANWNAKEGTSRIVDMPEVFRHSTETEGMEEVLLDTPEGWVKKEVTKLTMTVTFDDDTVKVYSMVGTEVTS